MTPADDYSSRMPTNQIDDAAAEALLSGRGVHTGLEPVAAIVQVLREAADRPVPPSATLAEQMATGVFTGPPEVYRAPVHGPQGRGLGAAASRGARACVHGLAAVPRKLSDLSLAAKAGALTLAAAAGLIGIGSAGFAGVLPEPVQGQFDTVVESVSPYESPRRDDLDPGTGNRPGEDGNPGGAITPAPAPDDRGRPTDLPTPSTVPGGPPTELPAGPPDDPGNQPTDGPGQGPPGNPGNRPTEHPGQGNERRPPVPPGQQGAG